VWSRLVVVLDVLAKQPSQVMLVDHDDVVQALLPECPDHALGDPVGLRTAKRRQHDFDAERASPRNEPTAEAGIAVADQKVRLPTAGCRLDQLTPDPVGCWVWRDVEVNQLSPPVLDGEEDVQSAEEQGRHREEVTGPDLPGVIGAECTPGLRGRSAPSFVHVAPYTLCADLDTKLQEFTADTLGAPQRVLPRYSPEQVFHFRRDPRTARPSMPALPGPVPPPGLTMPANHGLGPDDEQGRPPVLPDTGQPDPEQAVGGTQIEASALALVHGELLT